MRKVLFYFACGPGVLAWVAHEVVSYIIMNRPEYGPAALRTRDVLFLVGMAVFLISRFYKTLPRYTDPKA